MAHLDVEEASHAEPSSGVVAGTDNHFRMTILVALYGAKFGILTYWRANVRPGMIA